MTDTMTLELKRIGQLAVNARDVERATAFYRDVLGMRFLFTAPPKLAFFDCGGVRLMLAQPEKAEFDHPGSIVYYLVDDIESAAQVLKGRGVSFESDPHFVARMPDHDLWLGSFRDSEGNLLALMCEKKRA